MRAKIILTASTVFVLGAIATALSIDDANAKTDWNFRLSPFRGFIATRAQPPDIRISRTRGRLL